MGRAEHIRIGAVSLFGAHLVRLADALQIRAHLRATTEGSNESAVQPRLVDFELRIHQQAVAIKALDVVALVGTAIAKHVHAVIPHCGNDEHRGDGAPQWRRVEVGLAAGAQMKCTALDGDQTFAHEGVTAID